MARGARRLGLRAAGDVAPRNLSPVPVLAETAVFTTDHYGDAFWLVRRRATGAMRPTLAGELFVSSGAAIVREARAELGITTGDVGWTEGLFDAARERVIATLGASPALPAVDPGAVVPVEWLWLLLWVTYSRSRGADYEVVTPLQVELPRLGDAVGTPNEPTHAALNFDAAQLRRNPFTGAGFSVVGATPTRAPAKSSNAMALALGALGLLLVVER